MCTLFALAVSTAAEVRADVPVDLPYPAGEPTAEDIARQVFFVNHFYAVKNLLVEKEGKAHVTVLATRDQRGNIQTNTLRRFLNNDYQDGEIRAKDIALFESGKLRGTGMLITTYTEDTRSQSYAAWLPALKKIRRFSEPPHGDSWGGTDFTFGDIYLRKPRHETHELLGTETFPDCLGAMSLSDRERKNRYLAQLYEPQCGHKGKSVYRLKSTTRFDNWWYDYRISLVDTRTFADYRTEYFKGGKKIKVLDRDWASMGLDDPRGQFFRYWYGKNLNNGHETMINVPQDYVLWNQQVTEDLWTEEMLQSMPR